MKATSFSRTMHFVADEQDFRLACQSIRTAPAGGAHWVVTSDSADIPSELPKRAEWIRLPLGATGSNGDWFDAVRGLVAALNPEWVVMHKTFERQQPARAALVQRAFEGKATIAEAPTPAEHRRVGYVLKKFPRYSETFILREVLELEALGTPVQVFSLNPPLDGKFHHLLGRLQHTVVYLPPTARGKAVQSVIDRVDVDMRPAFQRLQWEIVDRKRPELFGYLAHAVNVATRAREQGIEHLHAHFATSATETARMAAALAGITYSFTTHAKDIYADTVDRAGYDSALGDARFAVTVCRANERYLHEQYPDRKDRVRVLYNGIDLDSVEEPAFTKDPHERPLILAVGRFVEKKGFDLFLDALAALKRERVAFRVRILGDGDLFETIDAQRRELGLEAEVEMPGAASMEQVREAMAEAAFLVCPSKVAADGDKDALPTVLLEAMSMGVPCVGTEVGGIGEILDDGRAGLLVPPDASHLARAMTRLLKSEDMRRDLGRIGRRRADELFDITRNVSTLQSWFDEPRTGGDPDLNGTGTTATLARESETHHVLFLSQDGGIAWDSPKGAAVHVRAMVQSARESGIGASVFVRDQLATSWLADEPEFSCVSPHRSITRYFKDRRGENTDPLSRELAAIARNAAACDAIERLHRERPIELVYERYSLWSDVGATVAGRLGIPFVVEVNAPLIDEQLRYRSLHLVDEARGIERRVLHAADRIIVVSRALRARVIELGVDAERVHVLPNVADPKRFACRDYEPRKPGDPFTIGFSGALKPWHGVSQFLDVFRQVITRRPEARLEILGDSRHRPKLEADVAALGLSDVVTFHGHVDHTEVPRHLAGWDLVVAPYPAMDDFYFSPLKIAEAMAAGRPIMATAIGDIPEVLDHGRHGILVPANAWSQWVDELVRLIDDPAAAVTTARSAKAEAATWSWDRHLEVAVGGLLPAGSKG